MATKLIDGTPSAYEYPLLLKYILHTPLAYAPRQEIVYKDVKRYDYVTLYKRIGQLANVLENMGVKAGDTVGVMDWDSHRYLECFFAVPMMGAILHTVNVRLSPEQILYTINHAEDDALLVHSDFLPIVEKLRGAMKTVKTIIVLNDHGPAPETSFEVAGEYEALLEKSPADYDFPDFNENSKATTFYTTGTTGAPKGVYFSHRQLVLHTLMLAACRGPGLPGGHMFKGCLHAPYPHVSRPRVGNALRGFHARLETGLSGTLHTRDYPGAYRKGRRNFFPQRSDHPSDGARLPGFRRRGLFRIQDDYRRLRPPQGIMQSGHATGHEYYCRLWAVRDMSGPHNC